MNVVLILAAAGIAGFLLLREPPKTVAQEAVEAALVGTEVGVTLETAASKVELRTITMSATKAALLRGDVLGAFIAGLAALTTIGARDDARHAWIDSIVAVWNELPDSWFLERSREQAGAEVGEFLPRPGTIVNMTELQWWVRFFSVATYADSYYNRLRDGYNNRMARILPSREELILVETKGGTRLTSPTLEARLQARLEARRLEAEASTTPVRIKV
jgi:hypothetical protein